MDKLNSLYKIQVDWSNGFRVTHVDRPTGRKAPPLHSGTKGNEVNNQLKTIHYTNHRSAAFSNYSKPRKSDSFKARGGSRFLSNISVQSNFRIKIIFELLTCPCKQIINLAVHVCHIAEINSEMS